jgi:hypothetical protein
MSGSVANAGIVPNTCRVAEAIAILATPIYCGWGSGLVAWDALPASGGLPAGVSPPSYAATGLVTPVGYRTLSVAKYCLPTMSGGDITLPTGNFASMRPRRAHLGCSHPTSPWIPRQSRHVFDRWPRTMGAVCQFLHDIVSTMSKSFTIPTIYRDSSGCGVPRSTSPLESARRIRNAFNQGRSSFSESWGILPDLAI